MAMGLDMLLNTHFEVIPHLELVDACRDRYGWFNVTFFQMWACSQCYCYLFPNHWKTIQLHSVLAEEIMNVEGTLISPNTTIFPDLFDGGALKNKHLCDSLGQERCAHLQSCCTAAISCCSSQIQSKNSTSYSTYQDGAEGCPKTWDGFACFQQTPPGQIASTQCPAYLGEDDNGIVEKLCTVNGTWATNPANGREWTDYSPCASLKKYRILYYVCISCNLISLLCLVPACAIFIKFKLLRKQHRIRIHLNLFMSLILTTSSWLGWDYLVFRNRLENPSEEALMHQTQYQVVCKLLYILSRYSWTCNCVWMSLEGFHLYRLINHAFQPPKSIRSYYFIGWMVPLLPISIYSITRINKKDSSCWVENAKNLEWIMYGPILACILVNVAFLTNILRIILTQIQSHPNEPSNYRRALKATCILVPLFGIQLFWIAYRPNGEVMSYFNYEVIATVIGNSQGAAVATVFCFLNSEVHGQFRSRLSWIRTQHSANDIRSYTLSTEMRRASGRDNRLESIPLTCQVVCSGINNESEANRRSNSSISSLRWQTTYADGKPTRGHLV